MECSKLALASNQKNNNSNNKYVEINAANSQSMGYFLCDQNRTTALYIEKVVDIQVSGFGYFSHTH